MQNNVPKIYVDPTAEKPLRCPHCGAEIFDEEECDACGGQYEVVYPKGSRTIKIVRDGHVITQGRDHHIMIASLEGKMIYHASCAKPFSIKELEEHWEFVKKLIKGVKNV